MLFTELDRIGRAFEVDKDYAFCPIAESIILTFQKDLTWEINKREVPINLPRPANESDTSGVGAVAVGYGSWEWIAGLKAKKQERFLFLLEQAEVENPKNQGVGLLVRLVKQLQSADSPAHDRFVKQIQTLMGKKPKKMVIAFEFNGHCLFEAGSSEGKWWEKRYEEEYLKSAADSQGTVLYGLCGVTLEEDVIAPLHLSLPRNSLNMKKGAALWSRNYSACEDPEYQQSEPARIGSRASRRIGLTLQKLLRNNLHVRPGQSAKTCYYQTYPKKKPTKILHYVYFSPTMGEELKLLTLLYQPLKSDERYDKQKAEKAQRQIRVTQYISALWNRLHFQTGGPIPCPSDTLVTYCEIFEQIGRANIVDYKSMPVGRLFECVTKWFNDLSIADYNGNIHDQFTFFRLKEACLPTAVLEAKDQPFHLDESIFFNAALEGRNLPGHLIYPMLSVMMKDMHKKHEDDEHQYRWRMRARLAMLKLFAIRRGFKITPDCTMEGQWDRAYVLGALYGICEENYYRGSEKGYASNVFHAKFLAMTLRSPARVLTRLIKNFVIYNSKLKSCAKHYQRALKILFSHLSVDDLQPIQSTEDKILFLLGWHGIKCQIRPDVVNGKYVCKFDFRIREAIASAFPWGALLAQYYREYKSYCDRQGNPDKFLLTYLAPFLRKTPKTIDHLQTLAEKVWSKKAPCHAACEAIRKTILAENHVPEMFPASERGLVIQGFFNSLGVNSCPPK